MSGTVSYSFVAAFDGIPLNVTSIATSTSRRIDTYQPERGDGAEVFDRGQSLRTDRVEAALVGSNDQVRDGLRRLTALADEGTVRRFSHPIDGEWNARIGDFSTTLQAGPITVSMSLLQFTELPTAERNRQSPDEEVTARDVVVDANIADNTIELLRLPPVDISSQVEPATSWTEDTPANERTEAVARLRATLGPTIEALSATTEYQALIDVRRSVATLQRWSDTLSSGGWQFGEVRVASPVSLFSLLNTTYGSRLSRDIFEQVQALNEIRDPTRLTIGTRLRLPTRDSLGL